MIQSVTIPVDVTNVTGVFFHDVKSVIVVTPVIVVSRVGVVMTVMVIVRVVTVANYVI